MCAVGAVFNHKSATSTTKYARLNDDKIKFAALAVKPRDGQIIPINVLARHACNSKLSIAGAWNGNRTRTPAMNEAADFKSAVSTYFTIQAQRGDWRRGPESNRASRICNPVHNRFVTAPHSQQSKA